MTDLFGKEVIRAIGLYQPFASLMLHGKIETRWVNNGRKPPFPLGKYLIYSCKTPYADGAFRHIMNKAEYGKCIDLKQSDDSFNLNGYAICLLDFIKIIDPVPPGIEDKTFVSYMSPGVVNRRVGIVASNVQRIKPFKFKGKQGISFLTEEQKQQIQII